MTTKTRIYVATVAGQRRLVRASHPAQVYAYIARAMVSDVTVANQDAMLTAIGAGLKVEDAAEDPGASAPSLAQPPLL